MNPWLLEVFDSLPSTSDYCIAQAKAGAAAGLAVMARRQTGGRGSRGRAWQAPEGNLSLSVLLRPATPAAQAGMFSLLAGVAIAKALPVPAMLKWPNDVLLDGAKLAGILIDAAPQGKYLDWLVIGIGINLAAAPEIPGRPATSLQAHGVSWSAEEAAQAVLQQLSLWQVAPPSAICASWLSLAHPVGTPLLVNGTKPGQFAGLTPAGELLLATDHGIETLNTGEIMLAATGRERQSHAAGD